MYIKSRDQYLKEDNSSGSFELYVSYLNTVTDFGEDVLEINKPCDIYFTGDVEIVTEEVYDWNFVSFTYMLTPPQVKELGISDRVIQQGNSLVLTVKDTDPKKPLIHDPNSKRNKFTNKKDAIRFVEMLGNVYTRENKTKHLGILGKLNNTQLSKVEDGPFCKWIKDNFGSFSEMEKNIIYEEMY